MKKNCFIILDTNICIYRTLAYVKPRILRREELDKVTEKIDTLTNNNLSCKIIVLDVVAQELSSNEILFWEISQFCTNKLHHKIGSYKTLKIFEQAKKSIIKFILKYKLSKELREELVEPRELTEIDKFYLNYPEKLSKITNNKLKYLNSSQQTRKLLERPNNLPEDNDRLLLLEVIRINESNDNEVYLFSNDGDFTEFGKEIKENFDITILKVDDFITEE